MARSRSIKPGFFTNEELAELGPEAMLLYAGLWTIADRAGRLEDRPKRIRAEVFPYWPKCNVEKLLNDLAGAGFIVRYKVPAAGSYISIPTWNKHQSPHIKEKQSTIPAPCSHGAEPVPAPEIPERAHLTPSSLTPDSLNTDSGAPRQTAPPAPARVLEMPASEDNGFQEVWDRWPRQTNKESALRDWLSLVTPQNKTAVVACADRYLESDEVARGAVRNLGTSYSRGTVNPGWLADCARDNWQCNWPKARDSPGPRVTTRQQENADAWSRA